MVLAILTSCSPNSSETIVNKGSLVSLKFNAPGTVSVYGVYALIDHEYTTDDYSVYAVYSSGYEENVTGKATIKGDHVKVSSSGSLTFSDELYGIHEFTVKASYEGKEVSKVVYAYRPGDAIGGLDVKKTKFFEGSKLSRDIARITYVVDTKTVSSTYLPSSGVTMIYNEKAETLDDMLVISTLGEIRPLKVGDATIFYGVYEDSELSYIDIEVVPLSDAKSLKPSYPSPYIKKGETIDMDSFASTYLKNYKARIGNAETYSDSTVTSLFSVTDEDGKENDGFAVEVTVSRKNSEGKLVKVTSGTFQDGDNILIEVSYKISENNTVKGAISYNL